MNTSPEYWVASFEKGLSVIQSFDWKNPKLTISQVASSSEISRSAARRYLLTMQDLGYVDSDGKFFWLTHKVLRLGASFLESSLVVTRVQPYLHQLTSETGESSFFSVKDHSDVMYIAKAVPNRVTNRGFSIGMYAPLFVTSAGIAIASTLSESVLNSLLDQYEARKFTQATELDKSSILNNVHQSHKNGYAVSEKQFDDGVRGIAVPIHGRSGNLFGAISINMFASMEDREESIKRILPKLQKIAMNLQGIL